MFNELDMLLHVTTIDAAPSDYRAAIVDENVLLKPSASTRIKTYSYLRDRFGLDSAVGIFAILRILWDRDPDGRRLMALLVAAFRDPVLRSTLDLIIDRDPDTRVASREFGAIIATEFPDKLTEKTLQTTGERMSSSYRQTGHLKGIAQSVRQRVQPTPGSATIALLIATLEGSGGLALLDSPWVRLLDSPNELILSEARIASARGWLEYRQAGDVLEITFRTLLESIGRTS